MISIICLFERAMIKIPFDSKLFFAINFLGKYSTEAVGDYLAGPNHVLPTAGSAKFSSGLSVYDFYKRISYINLSKKGLETLGPSVITMANFEGLKGHAKSVELRIRRK